MLRGRAASRPAHGEVPTPQGGSEEGAQGRAARARARRDRTHPRTRHRLAHPLARAQARRERGQVPRFHRGFERLALGDRCPQPLLLVLGQPRARGRATVDALPWPRPLRDRGRGGRGPLRRAVEIARRGDPPTRAVSRLPALPPHAEGRVLAAPERRAAVRRARPLRRLSRSRAGRLRADAVRAARATRASSCATRSTA